MHFSARTAPLVAALLGIAAVFGSVPLVGLTMAVATPTAISLWLRETTSPEFASFTWDLLVVYGPTLGLLLLLCSVALRIIYRRPGVSVSALLAIGALVGIYLLVPLAFGETFRHPLPWWASAAEVSVLVACAATAPLLSRKKS